MKRTERFNFTITLPDVCDLTLIGEATSDDNGVYNWNYERVAVNHILMTDGMVKLFEYSCDCNSRLEEMIFEKIVECFRPQEPEDTTTDMQQDNQMHPIFQGIFENIGRITRPEIYGELTDQNPAYGC